MKSNLRGYALPLALALVAIFSIVIASIESRSDLFNQTQLKIFNRFASEIRTQSLISIKGIRIPESITGNPPDMSP
jgi:hypothetical protein